MKTDRRKARPGFQPKRRGKPGPIPSEKWAWKEKAAVWGTLAGVIGLIMAAPIVDMRMKYLDAIDRRLSKWKLKYELSDDQVREIRRIEMDFHDFRSVAFGSKKRSTEEIDAHCREIAAHMSDSSAKVFLCDGDDQRE